MEYERLFDEDDEIIKKQIEQDKRAKESLYKLDNYLNTKHDYLEDIEEDNDVKIEDLKKLVDQLEDMKKEYEKPKENVSGTDQSKGKVLTKKLPGVNNQNLDNTDNTVEEIAKSFVNCFILCMVTAIMGAGWLLYIINHI